ncbi:GDSL esterase/lipase family [Quillaja saponaria]|uniref:GDSL esterase/lipase family n=1 Tax=Quillaja saponaria TaxID=32244 RepID=A0AAD7PFS6_QUISA|nr:GDSL esterase/lipase family [Quillaja saponaria]
MSNFKATFLHLIPFIFVLLTRNLALVNGNAVPALYVFGDSTVDSGNNNYLNNFAKANYLPVGIDFITPATGRFTNGRTIADCVADMLGLPFAPPYLGLSEFERSKVMTGINYASAACGILPRSGSEAGTCLSMDKQTEYFMSTIEKDLPSIISNSEEVTLHLSKSIFLVSIGVNDYTTNYLINFKRTWTGYTPEAFGDFLLNEFVIRMQRHYHLGARQFVVNAAYPVGWAPYYVAKWHKS